MGGLIGGEGYLRYRRSKSKVVTKSRVYTYHYWRAQIELEMAEEAWVKRTAELCEVNYRQEPNGRYWEVVVAGSRAIRVLRVIRPFLMGLKAKAADAMLRMGPNLPGNIPRPDLPGLKKKSGPGGN